MNLSILHIDDEQDVLEKVAAVVTGTEILGHTLLIKDSCGFDEGMKKLEQTDYDLVILDLCIGKATSASDKVGENIFQQIQKRAFIPIVFFTGLPEYVKPQESNIVRIAAKAEGYDALFREIEHIIKTGFIKLKSDVYGIIKEGLRSYFWNFVHPKSDIIAQLQSDDISLKYLLLRRLGKTLSSEVIRASVDDPQLKDEFSHPMEFYIFPPVDGEFETGDIIKSKTIGNVSVILTPACDLVARKDGKRSADKILIVHTLPFKETPEFKKFMEFQKMEAEATAAGKSLEKKDADQLRNMPDRLKQMMKPNNKERFFFLPPTPFLDACFVDFQHKDTITYDDLEKGFDVVATLDDPICQAVLSSYARYHSRVGYGDLDTTYIYDKIIGK